jgi:CheY-like chemotaxis protein
MSQYNQILLIDDDDREIFLTALKRIERPIPCQALNDARLALDQLIQKKLHTDLIFLDLNMPVMNGQQFLIEIKRHPELKHIPIIILSTTSHQPTINLVMDLGAIDFITKPEEFTDLVKILSATIN